MGFSTLKDLLPTAASKLNLAQDLHSALIKNRAGAVIKEIFPEEIAGLIRVKRFYQGMLWLAVNNSAVANEVQLKSHLLIGKINASLGEEVVKKIRSFQQASTLPDNC